VIDPQVSAWTFLACSLGLALFQLALALGAPWGRLAMGGRFPGRFPPAMRIAALAQIAIYGLMGAVVFARAGVALTEWSEVSRVAIWFVVGVMALALVLNLVTLSKWERRLWAPVALVMFAAALHVALSG
jgi:hypothetical protein